MTARRLRGALFAVFSLPATMAATHESMKLADRVDRRDAGTRSGAAPRSAPAAPTATPRRSPSGSAACPGHPYEQGFDLRLVPEKLAEPLRWTAPQMVFVNSMSDLFHEDVPDDYIERGLPASCSAANWHTYQVLTKRSERMRDAAPDRLRVRRAQPHIWWGVSVENRKHGLPRIDHLRDAPAGVAVPLGRAAARRPRADRPGRDRLGDRRRRERPGGAGRWRPTGSASIRDQCGAAGVPFFFKQWGGVRRRRPAASSTAGRTTRCLIVQAQVEFHQLSPARF